jgi:hypothetical protein
MLFSPFLPFTLDIGLRFSDLPGVSFSKERDEVILACPLPVFELRILGDTRFAIMLPTSVYCKPET